MRIVCIGGGPAGLYFSILLKKTFPTADISVHEKNQPDDTFGWGVVFSKETLGTFAQEDAESYREIEARFAYWDDIDVVLRGERVTSTGHGFCGLARRDLLLLLQARAKQLGVRLEFGAEVPAEPLPQADMVIACDGVHSPLRERYASHFEPTIDWRKCKFTWLGATLPLSAFTFLFRETPHGLFQVHAYPFTNEPMQPSGARSTFIVECREEVWRAAGLDTATEGDTVAFFEKMFADELKGHRLCANKSVWRTFPTIRCKRWVKDNLVLLGDAAHTAHFSIGSGTKLAMEDAIALVASLQAHQGHIGLSLAHYEKTRKPEVERVQHAAQTSLEWFENAGRSTHQTPLQFTFNLMTRSKRITWANLRLRDPKLVSAVDEAFATKHGSSRNSDGSAPPPLFAPLTLRGLTLPNRVVVSPMCQYSAVEGTPTDWHLVHLGSRAVGGAGLVMTEMTNVSPEGRITHGCAGLWDATQAVAWQRIVEFIHTQSEAKVGMQLAHAGRKASAQRPWEGDGPLPPGDKAWATMGPSAIAFGPQWPTPHEMNGRDLERIRLAFVASTKTADAIGIDLIELHMAHGYLLSSFLSPLSNQRTDAYGGSLTKRMRFPLEVFDAVRAAWPEHKPLVVRLTANDWVGAQGMTVADAVEVARTLKAHGCDVIDVSSGGNVPYARPEYGRMYQVPFAEAIRAEAKLPVMAVGGIMSADHANTVLAAGRADLCALARAHLSDGALTLRHAQEASADRVPWPYQYAAVRPSRRQ